MMGAAAPLVRGSLLSVEKSLAGGWGENMREGGSERGEPLSVDDGNHGN